MREQGLYPIPPNSAGPDYTMRAATGPRGRRVAPAPSRWKRASGTTGRFGRCPVVPTGRKARLFSERPTAEAQGPQTLAGRP